jgi:hypothetical protein
MAVYYVSKYGDDNNNGSLNLPFLTIDYADTQISAGDTIYIAPGIYREKVQFSVGGAAGNHVRWIGDPDLNQFSQANLPAGSASYEKGVIRVTSANENEQYDGDANCYALYTYTKTYIEFHNIHADGGGSKTGTNSARNSYSFRGYNDVYDIYAFNCLAQGSSHGFYRISTANCLAISCGAYGFYQGEKQVNSIAIGGYSGFYQSDLCVDCIAIGGGVGGFWNVDKMVNCATIGGAVGFRCYDQNDYVYDSIAIGASTGFQSSFNTQAQGTVISGSFAQGNYGITYRGNISNFRWGAGNYRFVSNTNGYPYGWDGSAPGFQNISTGDVGLLWSYNKLIDIAEVLKPTLLNKMVRGASDSNHDSDRAQQDSSLEGPYTDYELQDIANSPRLLGERTASFHLNDNGLSKRDLGPWEFSTTEITSSINFSAVSQSTPGFRILGEGIKYFKIGQPSGSAITASVNVYYTSSATMKPSISFKYFKTMPSSSTYNGNLFAYSTGSQLDIQTTIATANQNTWTNVAVSASPSSNDQVLQLQLYARSTGSATASFSDILIQ